MIKAAVRNDVVAFFFRQLKKWIAVVVVVKVRKMNERTAELVDGLRPALQVLRKVDHLSVGDLCVGTLPSPFLPLDRRLN